MGMEEVLAEQKSVKTHHLWAFVTANLSNSLSFCTLSNFISHFLLRIKSLQIRVYLNKLLE